MVTPDGIFHIGRLIYRVQESFINAADIFPVYFCTVNGLRIGAVSQAGYLVCFIYSNRFRNRACQYIVGLTGIGISIIPSIHIGHR